MSYFIQIIDKFELFYKHPIPWINYVIELAAYSRFLYENKELLKNMGPTVSKEMAA